MTNIDLYRQALVAEAEQIKLSFADKNLAIEYDNRATVDMREQTAPYLSFEVKFIGGKQLDLSSKPIHQITGMLVLTAKIRQGEGTAQAYNLLYHFYSKMQARSISGVHLQMAELDQPRLHSGWVGISALLPFRINNFPDN